VDSLPAVTATDIDTPILRPGRAWGLELGGGTAFVGPLTAFHRHTPSVTVKVISSDDVSGGVLTGRTEVVESGAAFAVDYYRFDGLEGLFHRGGGNWILWNAYMTQFYVTEQASWPTTWVHVRFLLRHLIVSRLIERPGHHCLHAVVARGAEDLGSDPTRGLLVAGPSRSGKTRLVNRLIEGGVVEDVVEDDCPVIDDDWRMTSLIPTQHELRRPRHLDVAAVVLLDPEVDKPETAPAQVAAEFAVRTPTPWPAPWLPAAAPRRPEMAEVPPGLRVLRVSPRSDTDDTVIDAITDFWTA
jgi:hypothetical protein